MITFCHADMILYVDIRMMKPQALTDSSIAQHGDKRYNHGPDFHQL